MKRRTSAAARAGGRSSSSSSSRDQAGRGIAAAVGGQSRFLAISLDSDRDSEDGAKDNAERARKRARTVSPEAAASAATLDALDIGFDPERYEMLVQEFGRTETPASTLIRGNFDTNGGLVNRRLMRCSESWKRAVQQGSPFKTAITCCDAPISADVVYLVQQYMPLDPNDHSRRIKRRNTHGVVETVDKPRRRVTVEAVASLRIQLARSRVFNDEVHGDLLRTLQTSRDPALSRSIYSLLRTAQAVHLPASQCMNFAMPPFTGDHLVYLLQLLSSHSLPTTPDRALVYSETVDAAMRRQRDATAAAQARAEFDHQLARERGEAVSDPAATAAAATSDSDRGESGDDRSDDDDVRRRRANSSIAATARCRRAKTSSSIPRRGGAVVPVPDTLVLFFPRPGQDTVEPVDLLNCSLLLLYHVGLLMDEFIAQQSTYMVGMFAGRGQRQRIVNALFDVLSLDPAAVSAARLRDDGVGDLRLLHRMVCDAVSHVLQLCARWFSSTDAWQDFVTDVRDRVQREATPLRIRMLDAIHDAELKLELIDAALRYYPLKSLPTVDPRCEKLIKTLLHAQARPSLAKVMLYYWAHVPNKNIDNTITGVVVVDDAHGSVADDTHWLIAMLCAAVVTYLTPNPPTFLSNLLARVESSVFVASESTDDVRKSARRRWTSLFAEHDDAAGVSRCDDGADGDGEGAVDDDDDDDSTAAWVYAATQDDAYLHRLLPLHRERGLLQHVPAIIDVACERIRRGIGAAWTPEIDGRVQVVRAMLSPLVEQLLAATR